VSGGDRGGGTVQVGREQLANGNWQLTKAKRVHRGDAEALRKTGGFNRKGYRRRK
jgi:hypothetical protein